MEAQALFVRDFAIVMLVASVALLIFHRFKQPNILGYIVTGFLLGPHTPSLFGLGLKNEENLEMMSDMAIVLLMFSLGLEFSIRKLKQVGMPATIAAGTEVVIMFTTGCVIGKIFGWKMMDCLFLGAILSSSSTMVISKTMAELNLLRERFAGIIIGITVVEDIVCISMMAILASIAMTGTIQVTNITGTFGKLGLFFVLVLIFGLLLVPRLMNYVERSQKKELILVTSLGLCFGMALLAETLGYSTALGAFIIGALIAETRSIHDVEKVVQPIKDMFSAIFFVIVGTMIDPKAVVQYWPQILILCTAVVIAKTGACALGALATGNPFPTSMKVGLGMCNVGEVSFIILALGMSLNAIDEQLYPIGVSVAIATMLGTPFIFSNSDRIIRGCNKLIPKVLMQTLGIYINWYQHTGIENKGDPLADYAKRLCIKNVLNLVSITGIMILTVVLFKVIDGYIPQVTLFAGMNLLDLVNDSFYLVGVILCAPFILITHENHCALAHLIVQKALPANLAVFQKRFERIIYCAAAGALGVYWMLLISILIFHTYWIYAYALSVIAVLIAYPFRRYFESIYQKAEIEIEMILRGQNKKTPDVEKHSHNANVLANDTRLFELKEGMVGVGKRLNELDLHKKSGATVISIERNSSMIVSPGGDEELKAGDHIVLLGNTEQLDKAGMLIVGESSELFEI
ncbi:MAG: cation:proton antiporter [Verrucomicrobia bacterium]|nr:cation:proton antiporter [Verrucomicrobiota bacterium]